MAAGAPDLPLVHRAAPATGGEGSRPVRLPGQRIAVAQLAAAVVGAIDVFVLLWLVLPAPAHGGDMPSLIVWNGVLGVAYLVVSGAVATRSCRRALRDVEAWLSEGRPPAERERRATLSVPLRCAAIDAAGWFVAAVLFFLVNLTVSTRLGLHVGTTILMGGITCVAVGYLLTERLMRPYTARALASGPPLRPRGPGVAARLVLAWLSATGVPLVGLAVLGGKVLVSGGATLEETARSALVLAVLGFALGLVATYLVARSVADPLSALRRAIARIEAGDLDARVKVDDGSEVGLLQSGFNAMAGGLAERERLRDLFGRHVGEDVARRALDGDGVRLGGEVRDVAALFVDLVGSTSIAARRPPRDVVRLLNEFFAVVVDVVGRHGGWVNKFEGDAALVVFGAPDDHEDAAGAALVAARELRRRLHVLPEVDAAIGVSGGPCVAGNVGAERRFEYTVIGDPVNEAARLCELAKRRDARLLASGTVVDRAREDEGRRWSVCEEVVLRGRRRATRVCAPSPAPS